MKAQRQWIYNRQMIGKKGQIFFLSKPGDPQSTHTIILQNELDRKWIPSALLSLVRL